MNGTPRDNNKHFISFIHSGSINKRQQSNPSLQQNDNDNRGNHTIKKYTFGLYLHNEPSYFSNFMEPLKTLLIKNIEYRKECRAKW